MSHIISVLTKKKLKSLTEKNSFKTLDKFVIEFINEIFRMLLDLIDDKTCPGIGRDCCLDLIVKFVDRANGCDWTNKFIISGY
jgi:hypothetical protein